MCHHYPGQKKSKESGEGLFEFSELRLPWWKQLPLEFADCYPTRYVATLRLSFDDTWLLENRSWGLLPKTWKPTAKFTTAKSFQRSKINARSETITTTWPWKLAWRQRCVMIATGFCEPHVEGGEGLYTLPEHEVFAIPAIWDTYNGDDGNGNPLTCDSVVMLTTQANALVASTRKGPRMRQPCILTSPDDIQRYCSHEVTEHHQIADLLTPWPDDQMHCNRGRSPTLF